MVVDAVPCGVCGWMPGHVEHPCVPPTGMVGRVRPTSRHESHPDACPVCDGFGRVGRGETNATCGGRGRHPREVRAALAEVNAALSAVQRWGRPLSDMVRKVVSQRDEAVALVRQLRALGRLPVVGPIADPWWERCAEAIAAADEFLARLAATAGHQVTDDDGEA